MRRLVALRLELLDLAIQVLYGLLQLPLLLFVAIHLFLGQSGQVQSAKQRQLPPPFFALGADLGMELAPSRVDGLDGVRNRFGAILGEAVQTKVLSHVFVEVLLGPSGKHGDRQEGVVGLVVGAQNRGLVATVGQLAHLAHPQMVGQSRAPLGEFHGDLSAAGQPHTTSRELLHRPVSSWIFVIGQNGDVLESHGGEEFRAIGFAIEHQGEPVLARIVSQALLHLGGSGRVGFQPGHQIAA